METIIAATISGLTSMLVCLVTNRRAAIESRARHDEATALMTYKIDELTKRVEKHNNVIERTYELEKKASLFEEQMKVANHRIADLENI